MVSALAYACSSFDEEPSPSDGGLSEAGATDSSTPESGLDAIADGANEASTIDGGGDGGADAGMVMVTTAGSSFLIDRTEVTQEAFLAFRDKALATGGDAGFPSSCLGKMGVGPTSSNCIPASTPQQPVACVDWCDAFAYCASVGKRLCGRIGGGPTPPSLYNDPSVDQWSRACTGGQLGDRWPYGAAYDAMRCNTSDNADAGMKTLPGGSLPACVGSVAGLYDLSGNVAEWTDVCSGNRLNDTCLARGGAFDVGSYVSGCSNTMSITRQDYSKAIGFRCCRDLP